MLWYLLWLYPLFGIGLGIYYTVKYHKYGQPDATGFMVCVMAGFWPIGWYFCAKDIRGLVVEAKEQEEREHEALLVRVRREDRRRVRQEFAEFDKELRSGEPEPEKTFSWETVTTDEWTAITALGSPTVYTHEYYINEERLCDAPQFRVRDLPNYSKGGKIGP